ncbi:MAG: DUF3014 domain-containing protein [Candidatus Aminicenantes bacterium]|nr:DUF3014 domain-containing protein [Candidatus Aminicenantes bacterium]
MEEREKIIMSAVLTFVVLIVGFLLLYFLILKKPEPSDAAEKISSEDVAKAEVETGEKEGKLEPVEPVDVELDESDTFIRGMAEELSNKPTFKEWLETKNVIRRFVAAVDNIANGLSPRQQIDFFKPRGKFKAVTRKGTLYPDTSSYKRYDVVADVFVSLDANAAVQYFRRFKPLIQEAYKELGYPNTDFQVTLAAAIEELLSVPVLDDPLALEREVLSYKIADQDLENLSEAQKHLLRMGPENVRKIQTKLREMAYELRMLRKKEIP